MPAQTGTMPYPSLTKNLHHEIELVAAIGTGGKNIAAADAHKHIFGYAVGLDMTRRDLQGDMKKQGRPWDIGKASTRARPSARSCPARRPATSSNAEISLQVDGNDRQRSNVGKLIWNIGRDHRAPVGRLGAAARRPDLSPARPKASRRWCRATRWSATSPACRR